MKNLSRASICLKLKKDIVFSPEMRSEAIHLLKEMKPRISKSEITEVPILHERDAKVADLAVRKLSRTRKETYTQPNPDMTVSQREWIMDMRMLGWQFFMARILFIPPGFLIPEHTDDIEVEGATKAYRLHHTYIGDARCPMEWKFQNKYHKFDLAEGRSPYLIRVDLPHRTTVKSRKWRIHFIASLLQVPRSIGILSDSKIET